MAVGARENVVGAVLFYVYIVAALSITGYICHDLIWLYYKSFEIKKIKGRPAKEVARRRRVAQIFVALALLSFMVLSYHMLMFLILSYTAWASSTDILLPTRFLGEGGMVDLRGHNIGVQPWIWAKRSTLFQDFAETIVNDRRKYWWTQQALLYSLGWNIFMAIEGTRYQIPHLWAYYVLGQILPISFTQNLFCAATFLSQNPAHANKLKEPSARNQLGIGFLYLLGLLFAPKTVGTTQFYVILFGIRALLFAPYWFLRPRPGSKSHLAGGSGESLCWRYKRVALTLAVGGMILHIQQTVASLPIANAIIAGGENPAVAALGYDYVIGVLSLVLLFLLK